MDLSLRGGVEIHFIQNSDSAIYISILFFANPDFDFFQITTASFLIVKYVCLCHKIVDSYLLIVRICHIESATFFGWKQMAIVNFGWFCSNEDNCRGCKINLSVISARPVSAFWTWKNLREKVEKFFGHISLVHLWPPTCLPNHRYAGRQNKFWH